MLTDRRLDVEQSDQIGVQRGWFVGVSCVVGEWVSCDVAGELTSAKTHVGVEHTKSTVNTQGVASHSPLLTRRSRPRD